MIATRTSELVAQFKSNQSLLAHTATTLPSLRVSSRDIFRPAGYRLSYIIIITSCFSFLDAVMAADSMALCLVAPLVLRTSLNS